MWNHQITRCSVTISFPPKLIVFQGFRIAFQFKIFYLFDKVLLTNISKVKNLTCFWTFRTEDRVKHVFIQSKIQLENFKDSQLLKHHTRQIQVSQSIFSHQLGHEVGCINVASPDLKVWLPWTNVLSLIVCVKNENRFIFKTFVGNLRLDAAFCLGRHKLRQSK